MTHPPADDASTRPRCRAVVRRTGLRCRNAPISGSTVCRMHGGSAPQVRAAAARNVARDAALSEARRLGGSLEVDPHEALLAQVHEAAANVAVLRSAISELGVEVARDGAVAVPEQVIEFEKGGTHVDAKVHVLVAMYDSERDRLVKYAKLAIDAGVAERQVRVAEAQAERLGAAFGRALDAAAEHITAAGREALRRALAAELRGLAAGKSG